MSVTIKEWYIVQTQGNTEKRVADAIRERAKISGLEEMIEDIIIPAEEITEIRRGKRVSGERKLFPSYVMIKMEMNDASFHLVRQTKDVINFLSLGKVPQVASQAEIDRILQQMQHGAIVKSEKQSFEIGEMILVKNGPFESFNGLVEEIHDEQEKLKVSVSIFGRATPVELKYDQVEKM